jgi:lipopolysaccharide heptosyltransferase II
MRLVKRIVKFIALALSGRKSASREEALELWKAADECLIISASGLGDALMATPLVSRIKEVRSAMRIRVVASQRTAAVFERDPDVDEIITYRTGSWASLVRLLWKVKRKRRCVLLAAQPSNTVSQSLIVLVSGAGLRLKHEYKYGRASERDYSFVYHALIPDVEGRHRVEKNLDMLRYLGEDIGENTSRLAFHVSDEIRAKMAGDLASICSPDECAGIVAVHPGGLSPEKRWNPFNFAHICRELMDDGFQIVLVGSGEDRSHTRKIISDTGREGVRDSTGSLTLEECAALLSSCRLLISNDTGIMHLAVAVGTPVVAIFGPTDPGHIGPYDVNSRVVSKGSTMENTGPSDVMEAVHQLLSMKDGGLSGRRQGPEVTSLGRLGDHQ